MAILPDNRHRYRIMCAAGLTNDTFSAESNADGAAVTARAWNGGNGQVWRVQQAGTSDFVYLRFELNDYSLEIKQGSLHDIENYSPTLLKKFTQTYAMKWYLEPAYVLDDQGEPTSEPLMVDVWGYDYQAYYIHCLGSKTSRVLATNYNGTQAIVIQTQVLGDVNQLWVFMPDAYGMQTPSSGAVRTSPTGADTTEPIVADSTTIYPSFICNAGAYQGRVRVRTRGVTDGDDDLSEWGYYECVNPAMGTTVNMGMGSDCTAASMPTTLRSGRRVGNNGLVLDLEDAYDRIDVHYQVRSFTPSMSAIQGIPSHSALFNITARLVKPIEVTSATITALPDGIIVDWETEWPRPCTTKVTCALFGSVATADTLLEIPSSKLKARPGVGETYTITFEISTGDGARMTKTYNAQVVSEGGTGLTLTCTDSSHIATFEANQEDARAWLVVHRGNRDRFVEFEGVTSTGKTTFEIPVPLGVPYKIWASYADTANDTWGSNVFEFDAIVERPRAMHFTSANLARDMALTFHSDKGGPELTSSYSRESTEAITAGGTRPFYGMGRTTKATHKVKGVFVTAIDSADEMENFDWLAESNHIYFRSPRGFWAQGVVDTCDIDRSTATKHPVNVAFNEEEW